MGIIQITNLKIDQYLINIDFFEGEAVAFWSLDKEIIGKLFKIIAGINKSHGACKYHDQDVFDNKEYFTKRLCFDYVKKYLSTLKLDYLEKRFAGKYGLHFNKDEFRRISEILDVRGETEITNVFNYTKVGNTFVNYALTRSLEKQYIIINNPTLNVALKSDLDVITSGLVDKEKYKLVILGPDNLNVFQKKLDKVMFFSDYNKKLIVTNKEDNLIVAQNPVPDCISPYDIIYQDNVVTIAVNNKNTTRDAKKQTKCNVISIYEIDNYIEARLWKIVNFQGFGIIIIFN